MYGDRFPHNYEKVDLLGKGGCALVWLGRSLTSGRTHALKQFPKHGTDFKQKADIESARTESAVCRALFDKGGKPRMNEEEFPGVNSIAALVDEIDERNDFWLVYEVGGPSLSKALFEVKGEFYKGERIYNVTYKPFYLALKTDRELLIDFIRRMLEVFHVL